MALANGLGAAGHPPESLRTTARVQLRNLDGAITLARIDLETKGDVPGIDERQFHAYAEAAKRDCPVSRALAGIPEITLTRKAAHCRARRRTGAARPMSTNDQPVCPSRSACAKRHRAKHSASTDDRRSSTGGRPRSSRPYPRRNRTGAGDRQDRGTRGVHAEEWAAEVYARLVRRVGHPGAGDGDLSGALRGMSRLIEVPEYEVRRGRARRPGTDRARRSRHAERLRPARVAACSSLTPKRPSPRSGRSSSGPGRTRMRVVYSQDTHREGDPEWRIWPEQPARAAGAGRSSTSSRRARRRRPAQTSLRRVLRHASRSPAAALGRRHARDLRHRCEHLRALHGRERRAALVRGRDPARRDLCAGPVRPRVVATPDRIRLCRPDNYRGSAGLRPRGQASGPTINPELLQ